MTTGQFKSTRIDCWCRVQLQDGFEGVVTQITRGPEWGEGLYYHISGIKLRCVPRKQIKQILSTGEACLAQPFPSPNPQKETP